jgi:hypothetical protein
MSHRKFEHPGHGSSRFFILRYSERHIEKEVRDFGEGLIWL